MTPSAAAIEEFISLFPCFEQHEEMVGKLLSNSRRQKFQPQTHLYLEGDCCSAIAFLYEGQVRVYKSAESGREITLYQIGRGETCILNASCIVGNNPYPANAVTAKAGEMLLVPATHFREVVANHEPMRSFVFSLLSARLTAIMELVNEVAFGRMDERLLDYLLEKSANSVLDATHQQIANDLGSSREVVSRLLKELERRGKVSLGRHSIRLVG